MSQCDLTLLNHLKRLSRLDISAEEDERLLTSLNRVLEYVRLLNEVDTSDTRPCTHILEQLHSLPLREDEWGELLSREEFLSNAPDQIGGMVRIPPLMKGSS